MYNKFHIRAVISRISHPAFLMFVLSGVGLVLGTLLAAYTDFSSFSLMQLVADSRLSIACHLSLQLLPFLFAAYAVNISGWWLLNTICFLRIFFFSYIGSLIWIAFGTAGWLVRFLVLFSDIVLVPVLFWYCFRRTIGESATGNREFWICIGAVVFTALINWLLISPFLARIIDI